MLSGGQETVSSGGLASATTVMSYGLETVSAGGSAVGAVVSSFGSETILAGGTAAQTDVKMYGDQVVSSGGSAVSATLEQNGTQIVSSGGTASATQVSGILSLQGGQTVSSVVATGGTEQVQSGLASGMTIQSGGRGTVSIGGTATQTQVENGGSLSASAAIVSSTQVQSGGQLFLSGGQTYVWTSNTVSQGITYGSSVSATVQSGGMIIVGADGSATGDVISSGGYVEVQSGGVVSSETFESGGLLILDNGGTVTGTNISGVLAGVVVRDGQGSLISAIVQSGDNTLQSLDLTSLGSAGAVHNILVASGETVNNLSVGNSQSYAYANILSIGGVVSGLTLSAGDVTVLQGGVLEGAVGCGSSTNSFSIGGNITNSGGTVSGVQLSSGMWLNNQSGTINGLTIESGAGMQTTTTTLSNVVVESGGALDISNISGGTGRAVGTLNVGAQLDVNNANSATQQGNTVEIVSAGTVTETFTVIPSADVQPGESAVLVRSSGACLLREGYVVSAGQTSSGLVIPRNHELLVQAGGTSVDATLNGSSLVGVGVASAAEEDVWGSSLGANITSAQQFVHSGGVASGATLQDFSSQTVSSGGRAVDTLVDSESWQVLESGGSVTGTILANGGDQALDGGVAVNTTIGSGSWETLYGSSVASGSIIQSGGMTNVGQSNALEGFTVEGGGQLNAYGWAALQGEVKSGGTFEIENVASAGAGVAQTTDVTVDLGAHLLFGNGLSGQVENDTLLITSGGATVESFAIGNLPPNAGGEAPLLQEVTSGYQTYYELDDGTPCYCPGTLIATTRGEVAVEDLKIGDRVVTAAGKRRPIRWIGNRAYSGRFAATNPEVLPVLFRAGSLGEGLPRRDLMVSPLHAMYLDGVLVPAQALVNGVSIVRLQQVDRVDYFHIELKTHDILLAEGAPAESFVDDDSRGMFHNAHEYAERYPNERKPAVQYCAPRAEEGPQLEAIRQRLNALPVARFAPVANAG